MRSPYNALFLFLLFLSAPAFADVVPERPSTYVVDLAGVVEDTVERKINGYLRELEQKTSAQVVVLTVRSMDGAALEDFSLHVAEKWGLGRKGKDNGVLMLFAMDERGYRIEVGYGLEGVLPDSLVGSIGRDYIVRYFRAGDYSTGVALAALAVAREIADADGVEISGMPGPSSEAYEPAGRKAQEEKGVLGVVLTVLFFIAMGYLFIRHPRLLLMMLLFSGMGGRRSHWGGGGFGGGFGGFGGGGGGSFGGGGASGRW